MENHCYSIEMEPRTLSEGQLNNAREAAVDIVQKKEPDEALNIFSEGMKPVVSIKRMEKKVEKRDQFHNLVEQKEGTEDIKKSSNCACNSTSLEESPNQMKIREPLSAPF